jgi:hypothetical protein
LLALSVALSLALSAGGPAPAGAAASGGSPSLLLVSQSPWVTPGQPFNLTVTFHPGAGLGVVVTAYHRLTNRSAFAVTLTAAPTGGVLDRTLPIPTGPTPGRGDLAVAVTPGPGDGAPATGLPAINLNCATTICAGVYPVVVSLERLTSGSVLGRLTTYLTYVDGPSAQPLRAGLVLPLHAPVVIRDASSDPATARPPLSSTTVASLAAAVSQLARYPGIPMTIEVVPETVQALEASGPLGRRAVSALGPLATGRAAQFPAQPYVPIDIGALSGLGTDLQAQMRTGQAILAPLGVHTQRGTWISRDGVGSNLASGLSQVGAGQLVVPESDLVAVTNRAGTFAQTFELQLGHGQQVRAAAADSGLSAHFMAQPHDPALAANQLLADLAFIHFEYPNLSTPRGVVAMPPAGWVPDPTFLATLLAGLDANPVVKPVTMNSFFNEVPATQRGGGAFNRRPSSTGAGPSLASSLAQSIVTARARLSAFASAVPSNPPVLSQLDQLLLASESSDLRASGQRAGVAASERSLDAQLSLVQLATDRTITLTARSASVPVTILSAAPYPLVGNLSLVSDKLFPEGSVHLAFNVNRSTNSVRVAVQAKTTGDLPLVVSLESPQGHLVITHGQLTVRSTATSLAGIVLTVVAAAVLLTWWARTWRRGRSRRAARRRRA